MKSIKEVVIHVIIQLQTCGACLHWKQQSCPIFQMPWTHCGCLQGYNAATIPLGTTEQITCTLILNTDCLYNMKQCHLEKLTLFDYLLYDVKRRLIKATQKLMLRQQKIPTCKGFLLRSAISSIKFLS